MEDNIRAKVKGLAAEEAIEILTAHLASHPDDEEALTLRGIKYWSAGRRSLAMADYLAAIRINQDRANIEKTFMELMNLANSMNREERRYVREGFTSDEELSLYDMLFDENLSKEDIKKIKKVAVDLLDKIKGKISELDHWTDKQETKAEIDTLIGKILWEELPECYSDQAIFTYRQKIYEYVYMKYKEVA